MDKKDGEIDGMGAFGLLYLLRAGIGYIGMWLLVAAILAIPLTLMWLFVKGAEKMRAKHCPELPAFPHFIIWASLSFVSYVVIVMFATSQGLLKAGEVSSAVVLIALVVGFFVAWAVETHEASKPKETFLLPQPPLPTVVPVPKRARDAKTGRWLAKQTTTSVQI